MIEKPIDGIRNIAIMGSYASGKTTLLESLLVQSGAPQRRGGARNASSGGATAPDSKQRPMGTELVVASSVYRNVRFNFLDCPGLVELQYEGLAAAMGADAVVVVCEPFADRLAPLASLFSFLDKWEIPHFVFVNKFDLENFDFREFLAALRDTSARPILLQQFPLGQGPEFAGYIDLIGEQAFEFTPPGGTQAVSISPEVSSDAQLARSELLETLADFDDVLMDELLSDLTPTYDEVLSDLRKGIRLDSFVPVFLGSAENDFGTLPFLNCLFEQMPLPLVAAERKKVPSHKGTCVAQVLKNFFVPLTGKISVCRVLSGNINEGVILNGQRVSSIYRLNGMQLQPISEAAEGDIVGFGRFEDAQTGDTLVTEGAKIALPFVDPPPPLYWLALATENKGDEVKLTSALAKLSEEDPSLSWEMRSETREIIARGQGEIHLQLALDQLRRKYNVAVRGSRPRVAYRETVRNSVQGVHGRYKHQTGGHGQFGDVILDVRTRDRGTGFYFEETIVGGAIPRQYIPGVEMGVREALDFGPLGFPVVDVHVTLTGGSFHAVDSSEQAFKVAGRMATQDALAKCDPVLLEPLHKLRVATPREFTSRVMQILSSRRGQILGFDLKPEIKNWEEIVAFFPESEIFDLILELRSQTAGCAFFVSEVSHLEFVPERLSDKVVSTQGRRARAS